MNQILKNIAWILTILLILLFTQWGGVMSNYLKNKVVEHTHDTLIEIETEIDTITNTITTEKILIREIETIVPATIDTQKVIREYFRTNVYVRNYEDSSFKATVIDTIALNKSIGQSLKLEIYRPTITKTITITHKPQIRTALYVSSGLTLRDKETILTLGATLSHKKHIYGLGFNPFDKSFNITLGTLIYKK